MGRARFWPRNHWLVGVSAIALIIADSPALVKAAGPEGDRVRHQGQVALHQRGLPPPEQHRQAVHGPLLHGQCQVVLVEVESDARRGALSEADGHTFAEAAAHADRNGLPLLGVISSSGADVRAGRSSTFSMRPFVCSRAHPLMRASDACSARKSSPSTRAPK